MSQEKNYPYQSSNHLPDNYIIKPDVAYALEHKQPVVALESAVITHGLPRPQNLELAQALQAEVVAQGAVPATIAVIDGVVQVGLNDSILERLAWEQRVRKISVRDFGIAAVRKECGGTTVAATLAAAQIAGIKVFATGGIGGVHRGGNYDISADLPELGRSPLVVVCAGAKAILDLPATIEYLETMGVPVLGYQTSEFPAFYSRGSDLPVTERVESVDEIARIAQAHWRFGQSSAVLVAVPPPPDAALPREAITAEIEQALKDCADQKISGAKVTPFLLQRVNELSGGSSMQANLALLKQNARLAGQIACALAAEI